MGITFQIDSAGGYVEAAWTGDVSLGVYRGYLAELFHSGAATELGRCLDDVREANLAMSSRDLEELARAVGERVGERTWRTAVVVARPEQYGMARQFQAFATRFTEVGIFYDRSEAIAWLVGSAKP